MTATRAAELIETTSARLCRDHYDMGPGDTWYHGGSGHNDDRLTAKVVGDSTIEVDLDGFTAIYDGPMEDDSIHDFVADWLENHWANS